MNENISTERLLEIRKRFLEIKKEITNLNKETGEANNQDWINLVDLNNHIKNRLFAEKVS